MHVSWINISHIAGPRRLCFVQAEFLLNQDRAEDYCNKHNTHLAKIESVEEVDLFLM